MCYQLIERFKECRCLYYTHAVDRCSDYGCVGHTISQREILVGYACFDHSAPQGYRLDLSNRSGRDSASACAPVVSWLSPDDEITTQLHSHQDPDDAGATKTLDPGDASDSESSDISASETVISFATSATLVNEDAVEDVFRRLMLFGNLRYLWPQLIARCEARGKCLQAIERLLRRYADDLGQLAQHTPKHSEAAIFLSACRFVRK